MPIDVEKLSEANGNGTPQAKRPIPPNGSGKRKAEQARSTAIQKGAQSSNAIRGQIKTSLNNAKSVVTDLATQREQAIEQVVDAIEQLSDPDLFMAEVFHRVDERLGKQSVTMENPYEDFSLSLDLPGFEVLKQLPSAS